MRAFPHRGHHQGVTLGRGGCWSRSDQAIRRRSDAALEVDRRKIGREANETSQRGDRIEKAPEAKKICVAGTRADPDVDHQHRRADACARAD